MNFPRRILFLLAILCSGHIYFSSPAGLIGISQDARIPDEALLDSLPAAPAQRTAAMRNEPCCSSPASSPEHPSREKGRRWQCDSLRFYLLGPESITQPNQNTISKRQGSFKPLVRAPFSRSGNLCPDPTARLLQAMAKHPRQRKHALSLPTAGLTLCCFAP